MLPDRVSNPGPLTYESGALPIALRGPATYMGKSYTVLVHRYLASVVLPPMMFYPFAVADGVFGLHCPFSLKEIISHTD